jgi:D-alanine-D-alanine ligase-like ATP-grasp enzyme
MKKYQVEDIAETLDVTIPHLFEEACRDIYGSKHVRVDHLQIDVNNFFANEEVPAYVKMYLLKLRRS